MKPDAITRRDFLKGSTAAAIAGTLYMDMPVSLFAAEAKSRVVLVRHPDVINDETYQPNAAILKQMLDDAVTTLLDAETPEAAWKQLIGPDDVVGIKTNVWRYLRTPVELEQAIKQRVVGCGVAEDRIGIDDRGILHDPIFQNATALINARPLRTHYWSGVGSLIKNYIMFDENPSAYHPDSCADLAAVWNKPEVRGKTRLNVLVLLTPLFNGSGPHHFSAEYTWPYKGLLVGLDPVAVDATGVRILLAKRKAFFGEERPLNPPPKHIYLADTRHGLGTADTAKIELIKLGWQDGVLI